MLGIVFTGGLGPKRDEVEEYLRRAQLIVAADSGLLLAEQMGVEPQIILGDMDSLPDREYLQRHKNAEIQVYPTEKDDTDTELALKCLRSRGCTDSILIGGGGGRLDHLLGIVSLFFRPNPPSRWFTHGEEIIYIAETLEIRGLKGRVVTFMPVSREGCLMKTEGLRWPLDSLCWHPGDIGISNIIVSDQARVTMLQGKLIMILPKKG
ncbi:MAG: thiamine diphosphokinase [Spirochaetes bacterium]|nr:thiamine diphosphokinase [Spirochaetota bacterium]